MSEQLYRLAEDDPEFGIYRKAIENRDGTLSDGVLVWYGHDNYLQGFLVPVTEELMTRAEWEASIDYKAAEYQFPLFTDDGHEYQLGHRSLQEWVRRIVNAALNIEEDHDEVE